MRQGEVDKQADGWGKQGDREKKREIGKEADRERCMRQSGRQLDKETERGKAEAAMQIDRGIDR